MSTWDITEKKAPCPECCEDIDWQHSMWGNAFFDLVRVPGEDGFCWKCRNCGMHIKAQGIEPAPFNTDEPVTLGQVEVQLLEDN